ncbi:hypothetical protein Cgig2_027115 [Carnegiea gigantea]|uniref:Uncharacterized protein n=1 Tax=Carnegiea gigantea TaxID=171969 RepID=A0A9Q1JU20_9CARY|nr:hypothetical protein Cgig2_027115 [Carnegiea gigantea]
MLKIWMTAISPQASIKTLLNSYMSSSPFHSLVAWSPTPNPSPEPPTPCHLQMPRLVPTFDSLLPENAQTCTGTNSSMRHHTLSSPRVLATSPHTCANHQPAAHSRRSSTNCKLFSGLSSLRTSRLQGAMDIEGQGNEIHVNENLNPISMITALEPLVEDDKRRSLVQLEFVVIDRKIFNDGKKRPK